MSDGWTQGQIRLAHCLKYRGQGVQLPLVAALAYPRQSLHHEADRLDFTWAMMTGLDSGLLSEEVRLEWICRRLRTDSFQFWPQLGGIEFQSLQVLLCTSRMQKCVLRPDTRFTPESTEQSGKSKEVVDTLIQKE